MPGPLTSICSGWFVKIRHFGILANRDRAANLAQARRQIAKLPEPPPLAAPTVRSLKLVAAPPRICPHCGRPALVLIRVIDRPKAPPILDSS